MQNAQDEKPLVPWTGIDVLVLFLLRLILISLAVGLALEFCGTGDSNAVSDSAEQADQASNAVKTTTDHPLTQLLKQGRDSNRILWIAFFSGVLAAPLAEEFLFRLLLQGWLEKAFGASRFFSFSAVSWFPGMSALLTTSLLFAASHAGTRSSQPVDYWGPVLIGGGIGNVLLLLLGTIYLVRLHGKVFFDYCIDLRRVPSDLGRGVVAFLFTAPLILLLNARLQQLFPDRVVDPIPLFLFSLVLGALFLGTRRLFPCAVLHACLNGFSFFALAFL